VIAALARSAALADATVICTSLDVPRALAATDLAARWRSIRPGPTIAQADPIAALTDALGRSGPVLVAGSLYLVGAARGHLVDDPDLRDPAPAREDA
jgi:folylpolyglutamate synthase/dihydropteroate synthase